MYFVCEDTLPNILDIVKYLLLLLSQTLPVTKKPVLVSSELEMSVMKNKIAELKAQMNSQNSRDRDRAISASGDGFNIVSMLRTDMTYTYVYHM